jgi:hypothetical protein
MVHIPHLETNVTIACTRRCIACNHFVPMQVDRVKASMITTEALRDDLLNFSRIARTDAWAAIGGEPLLHPKLEYLLMTARSCLAPGTRIEVWTNGEKLKPGAWDRAVEFYTWQIDELVVSAYPGVLTDADLAHIEAECRAVGITYRCNDERQHPNFTQLLVEGKGSDAETQARYDACWFKTYSRVLDGGYFYRCCTSPFIPQLLRGRTVGSDGLPMNAETTEAHLRAFLDQPLFMESCRVCAGRNTAEAHGIPWKEVKDPAAWREASGGGR